MLDFVQIDLHIKIIRLLNTLSAIHDGDVVQKSLVTISRLLLSQKRLNPFLPNASFLYP